MCDSGRVFVCQRNTLYASLCCVVPNITRNGLAGVLQRSLQPAFDDQVCFVATVRLAKPQFIKVRHTHTRANKITESLPNRLISSAVIAFIFVGDVHSRGA